MSLIPRQTLEVETGLVYKVSSRPARGIQGNPVSNKQAPKQTNTPPKKSKKRNKV